jgi:hypothetical protein
MMGGLNAEAAGLDSLRDRLRFLLRLYARSQTTTANVGQRINPLTNCKDDKIFLVAVHVAPWRHMLPETNGN